MKKENKKKTIVKKKIMKVSKPVKGAKVLPVKKAVKPKKKITVKAVKKVIARKPVKKVVKLKNIKPEKKEVEKMEKAVLPKTKKQVEKSQTKTSVEPFSAESLFKAKIKVIGIGGGGGSIVSEIGRSLEKATFVIADTDIRALKKKSGIKYFWFGEEFTHGLGTGVNVDLARQAAESAKEKISTIFKDQDIIIFVASLGGGLGSGATQVFAEAAKDFGGITLGIFTMPFRFEGKNKYRIAQNALRSLKQSLNVSLVIPNEKIFKVIDNSTPITNAFSTVNKSLIDSLESLIDLIYSPGVINIDFADLRTILKGRGNSAFLNTVEESGKDKVEKICENIFKNPLLQNNNFQAEKILFNIAGSDSLSMFDVEKISSHITSLNQQSKIIFGISKNPKLKNKIRTTILMTGGSSESSAEDDVLDSKSESVKEVALEKPVGKSQKVKKPTVKKAVAIKKEKKTIIKRKVKKIKAVKENRSVKKPAEKKALHDVEKVKEPVSFVPINKVLSSTEKKNKPLDVTVADSKLDFVKSDHKIDDNSNKKTIRRSGLEIKEAEELQEQQKMAQEKEWEIPAFLRKVKFKS